MRRLTASTSVPGEPCGSEWLQTTRKRRLLPCRFLAAKRSVEAVDSTWTPQCVASCGAVVRERLRCASLAIHQAKRCLSSHRLCAHAFSWKVSRHQIETLIADACWMCAGRCVRWKEFQRRASKSTFVQNFSYNETLTSSVSIRGKIEFWSHQEASE